MAETMVAMWVEGGGMEEEGSADSVPFAGSSDASSSDAGSSNGEGSVEGSVEVEVEVEVEDVDWSWRVVPASAEMPIRGSMGIEPRKGMSRREAREAPPPLP